jgi:Putative adhesin
MPVHTFPLDGPINLQVRIGHGAVTIETADNLTEATVSIEPGKHAGDLLEQTTVEMRGRTLLVSAPRQGGVFDLAVFGGRRSGRGLDVRIVIPTNTAVKISTHTAPIWITGQVGGADLSFGSGEAAVSDVTGDLRLRFGSGVAKAVQVSGSVQVRSGSGDVQFGEIGGNLRAGCGSGDLRVRVVHGAVVSRCGSGSAHLGEVHGDVDLASGSGAMEIGLPVGVTAHLDVHTGSGQTRSELPIEDQPNSATDSISLRARTGSGDVRLFRAA